MSDSEHLNPIRQFHVDDVMREAPNQQPADVVIRDTRRPRPKARIRGDQIQDRADRNEKLVAQPRPLLIVPTRGRLQLGVSLNADPERLTQRFVSPRLIRSRTSGQGLPGSSPDRARSARRSISRAQAASASSSTSASRLASSSAARSARSESSSLSASFKSFCAAVVTRPSLLRRGPSNNALELTGACERSRNRRTASGAPSWYSWRPQLNADR